MIFSLFHFFSAFCLGIPLALLMAESIDFSLYSLASKKSFSSFNLVSLSIGSVQVLTIRRPREKGMEVVTDLLWQLLGRRY